MIDFPVMPEVASKSSWVFCGLLYMFSFFYYQKCGIRLSATDKTKNVYYSLLVLLFIICPLYAGDFVHYQTYVYMYNGQDVFHLEVVYRYIITFVKNNYLAFRLIVWGVGFFVLLRSFRSYRLDVYKTLFFFTIYVIAFAYTRTGVALAIFYYGLSLLLHEDKTIRNTLVGLTLIVVSTFFHTSIGALVALTPAIFLPIKRKSIPLLLLLIFALSFFVVPLLNAGLEYFASESEESAYKLGLYTQGSTEGFGAGSSLLGMFGNIWPKLNVHIPYLICVKYMLEHEKNAPKNIKNIFRFSIALYLFVIIMWMTYGSNATLYTRYEGMLYIPITVIFCYMYQNNIINQQLYKKIVWFCYLCWFWFFSYRIIF